MMHSIDHDIDYYKFTFVELEKKYLLQKLYAILT